MKTKLVMLFMLAIVAVASVATVRTAAGPNHAGSSTVSAASGLPAEAAANSREPHPHIRAALHELREAQGELKRAAHDFGGHRDEALEATDKAIRQLEECLKYDKN